MRSLSFWKNFLLTVFFCGCGNECLAQTYPVEVTTILQPPYSLQLSDYSSPDFEAIRISVFLRELDRHEYKVKLRLTIQSESVTLVTKENFLPPPIYLQGGMTELITGADIASYFNLNNLDVFGNVNKGELLRRGMLPEGFYTFSVEVLDYNRSVAVSNKGEASAFLILNDPPIINLPLNGDKITATDPQNIMFSWTPRNLVSPNSAFTTEYEFSLVELYPIDRNPNDAIQSSNTIYTLRTTDTGLNYGMAEPMLTPGKKYAFRVRAIDTGGKDLFKNNGYSEVFVFQYGDACLPPLNLKGKALDHQRIGVEWEEGINHTGYVINYRVHGREDWFSDEVLDWRAIIPDLSAGLELDIKVSAKCGSLASVFTDQIMVKTLATAPDCKCAKPAVYVAPPAPDPNWLQEDLKPGDTITNNVFKYVMVEVQRRPDGTYNGLATGMTMEMLNWGRPRYKVRAVRLSRKYEILEGSVATIYNLAWRPANKLGQKGEEKEKAAEESKAMAVAEMKVEAEIKKVSVDATTGEIVIELASGETQRQARPRNDDKDKTVKDVRITDASGDVWTVGKDGKVTEFPKGPGAEVLAEASKADFTVQFSANPDQRYGFDTKTYEGGSYEKIKIKEADYIVAWKAIATGQQETVNAQAQGKSTFPTAVAFKRAQDVPATAGASASQRQVLITGGQDSQTEKLIAYVKVQQANNEVKELEVGRLNIKSYDQIREKVVIVPVNMATLEVASVAEELNKIYGQAVALWEVSIDNSFQYDQSELDQLDQDESDIISAFPDKMKAFNKAFKNSRTVDNDAYYIFLVPGGSHRYSGYMPFKRKFGYIFTSNTTSTSLPRTIAHELAHGAFRMRHNFSEYPSITRGTTDNLMDYSTGTVLKKYQWDEVHDPHARVSWLMEDEESAYSSTLIDEQHAALFDHVYENNKIGKLIYLEEINRILIENPKQDTFLLNYNHNNKYKDWINSWKVRVVNSEQVMENTIKVIQNAKKGQKIGKMIMRPKHIYIGKYKYNNRDYPVAIYNASANKDLENVFTKVEITDMDDLAKAENRKHVYIDETYYSYFVIAFYEEGNKSPSVMIQVEKFPFSDLLHNSMEEWMKFLKILINDNKNDASNKNSAEGEAIATIAKRIDQSDKRFYGRFIEPERLTDEYVDCAEFVYDVLKEHGFSTLPSGDCIAQSKWYKTREQEGLCTTGTDIDEVIAGDVILWTGTWAGSKEYAHTGIVVQKSQSNVNIVHAGQNGCKCDEGGSTTWKSHKTKIKNDSTGLEELVQKYSSMQECYNACTEKNYSIYNTSSYFDASTLNSSDHIFKYWARPRKNKR